MTFGFVRGQSTLSQSNTLMSAKTEAKQSAFDSSFAAPLRSLAAWTRFSLFVHTNEGRRNDLSLTKSNHLRCASLEPAPPLALAARRRSRLAGRKNQGRMRERDNKIKPLTRNFIYNLRACAHKSNKISANFCFCTLVSLSSLPYDSSLLASLASSVLQGSTN